MLCKDRSICCIDGRPLQGLESFWESEYPKLSPCFEHTVLIWLPCLIFWITLPFEVRRLMIEGKRKRRVDDGKPGKTDDGGPTVGVGENGVRRRVLFWARLISLLIILICSIVRIGAIGNYENPFPAVLSAFILCPISLAVLLAITVLRHRWLVAPPSAYSWLTLLGFFLFGVPEFVSLIQNASNPEASIFGMVSYFVQYAAILASLITFSISDLIVPKETDWPEEILAFPNTLIFWWYTRFLVKGFRSVLTIADMFTLSRYEQTRPVYEQFEKNLARVFGRKQREQRSKELGDWAMLSVLGRSFYKPVLAGAMLTFINAMLMFMAPLVITWLMAFVRDPDSPFWHGLIYVGILFGVTLIRSFCGQYHYHFMNKFGIRARAGIVAAVYRKALILSSEARRITNTGEIVNLMAVDSARFQDVAWMLHMLWSAPLQVLFGLYYIYGVIGHAVWAGVAVMAVIFTSTSLVSKQMQKLQTKQLTVKDQRIKLITEMLNGMKVVKLYAWEPAFERLVEQIRAKELKYLKIISYLFGSIEVSYCCTNLLACMAIFGTYCLLNPMHNVTAEVAFVVLTVFNIIYVPFTQLPLAASYTMMTLASVTRLRKFFCQEDLVAYVESRKSEFPVELEKASFKWEADASPTLNDINLRVKPGQLVAIVGSVGSGKSSLISAMCGDMLKASGSLYVNGTVAYVAQQAWIQNMTVRDNILFGLPYEERRYQRIVQACSLKPDLALLANGDLTIIGERGSNLSGGQKQRISIARAVYQNADIYLLDDPLSAVDVHVGKAIFDAVVGPHGLLKNKARVFVTHGVQYLPFCDSVVLMVGGKFLATGTFEELAKKHDAYAEFLENSLPQKESPSVMQQLSVVSDPAALHRAISSQQPSVGSRDANVSELILERLTSIRQSATSIMSLKKPTSEVAAEVQEGTVEEEEIHVGKVSWRVYWLYAKYGGFALLMHTIFIAFSELCYMGGTMWLEIWTDTVPSEIELATNITSHRGQSVISGAEGIGVLGAFTGVQLVTTLLYSLYFVCFVMLASTNIHKRLLKSMLRAPMSFFDTTPSGRITNRFGKDMNTIDNQIPGSTSMAIHFFIILITFFIPVIYANPIFVPILCPLMIIYVLFQKFYVASSRQFRRIEAVTRSPIYSHFQESLQGIATIRAYRQQSRFAVESDRLVDINHSAMMTLLASNRWLGVNLDFIGNLLVAGASLSAIFMRATMLPGLVGLSVSYALGITDILNWGVRELSLFETEVVALERVNEYTDTPDEAEWSSTAEVKSTIPMKWPARGLVEFNNYSTRYRSELPLVLKDFRCVIPAGEKVGVVGRTGAGKSSLTLALFRLIEPSNGTIVIDGVDISQMGLHDLRRQLTIIPQEPVLFSGTLRQNIDPFEEYPDADLFRALNLSHLNEFVETLEGGLNHEISEGGANLSVGQRQLLCLARALLRKTKILILDEATASVDYETDALIQRTVREQFADCTVITIAHRLNTILDYDRVMVLDMGRLVEYDSPASLIDDDRSEFGRMIQEAGIRVSSNDLMKSSTRL